MIDIQHAQLKVFDHSRRQKTILDAIELHLNQGEYSLLKGPSGSGKSSLLSLIAGLKRPSSGDILIDGKSIAMIPDRFSSKMRADHIGFIFQKFNLISDLNIIDNMTLPLLPSRLSVETIKDRAERILDTLKLTSLRQQNIGSLSGGEQQRVAIGRALINDPKIILADEPTANLDDELFQQFVEIMTGLKDSGLTLLLSSHDPRFREETLFDSVHHISKGRLIEE